MDAKCFGGASRVRHRGRGGAEDACHGRRGACAAGDRRDGARPRHAPGHGPRFPPARPITLVVPFRAERRATTSWRVSSGERMGKALGQQIVVENRPGGRPGNIGSRQGRRAARPDGYTMLLAVHRATIGINPSPLRPISATNPAKDLTPIGSIAHQPRRAGGCIRRLPVKTLEGADRPTPRPIRASSATRSSGVGTVVHVATEMLADAAGIKGGAGPRTRARVPGSPTCSAEHVKMMMPPIPAMIG